jgi:hypothetical protein
MVTAMALTIGVVLGIIVAMVRTGYDQQRPGKKNPFLGILNAICQVYITVIRGTPVVEIPQSYTDETNKETVIDPKYAYVLPSGKEKVVKVVFEGNTQVRDLTNADGSMEIHTYKKMGAAILTYHNWGIYENTSL